MYHWYGSRTTILISSRSTSLTVELGPIHPNYALQVLADLQLYRSYPSWFFERLAFLLFGECRFDTAVWAETLIDGWWLLSGVNHTSGLYYPSVGPFGMTSLFSAAGVSSTLSRLLHPWLLLSYHFDILHRWSGIASKLSQFSQVSSLCVDSLLAWPWILLAPLF